MSNERQYSLAYLMLIVFWFAVALGLMRAAPLFWADRNLWLVPIVLNPTALGAAVGGFIKSMRLLAAISCAIVVIPIALQRAFIWALNFLDL